VQILGISADSTFALRTYADSLKIEFPLRAFFLIDEKGMLRKQSLLGLPGDDIVFAREPILEAVPELKAKR
jgi:hypothetical protein